MVVAKLCDCDFVRDEESDFDRLLVLVIDLVVDLLPEGVFVGETGISLDFELDALLEIDFDTVENLDGV